MNKVLVVGSVGAGVLYIITGIFGLVAFAACGPKGYPEDPFTDEPWDYDSIFN